MKIETSNGNIETIGDITEFKTGIDPKNLEFITTLLSSNLYSDPEQSFIREIVSNAWDSHVEAGTTDIPVIIKIDTDNSRVSIRDYGTGLSPERFKEVYCNIGSSTKRDTNDYIGGFGIGKYSSLACSNVVNITSYYNHIKYSYIMIKSGNEIVTNLVSKLPTDEKNGVMVEIPITPKESYFKYALALDYIPFFPNVYLDDSCYNDSSCNYTARSIVNRFNDTKIKRFKYFACANKEIKNKFLLGNVLYPCNTSLLGNVESNMILSNIANTGIVISFNVGELNITPNRESIIYTKDTIDIINNRIKEANDELMSIVHNKLDKDFDDIYEYDEAIDTTYSINLVEDKIARYSCVDDGGLTLYDSITKDIFKLKGVLCNDVSFIHQLCSIAWPHIKSSIYDGRIYSKDKLTNSSVINVRYNRDRVIAVPKGYKLTNILKEYLRENYDGYVILEDIQSRESFRQDVESGNSFYKDRPRYKDFIEMILDSMYSHVKFVDFYKDKDFLKFKEEKSKSNKGKNAKKEQDVILHQFSIQNEYPISTEFNNLYHGIDKAVEHIKDIKHPVILDNIGTFNAGIARIAYYRNVVYIAINKKDLAYIKSLNLRNVVSLDWLTKHDKFIIRIHTIMKCMSKLANLEGYNKVLNTIPGMYHDDIMRVVDTYMTYKNAGSYRVASDSVEKEDSYTRFLCDKFIDYYTKYKNAEEIVAEEGMTIDCGSTPIINSLILKQKLYRISYNSYKLVKSNKIIEILCRK